MRKLFLLLTFLIACTLPGLADVRVGSANSLPNDKDITERFWQAVYGSNLDQLRKAIRKDKRLAFAKRDGMTAFLYAVQKGNKQMAWALADEFWSRVNEQCPWGNALHLAVMNNDLGMVKLVMKAAQLDDDEEVLGRLINGPRTMAVPGQQGGGDLNTPLHLAAIACNREMYDYLVAFGGNENARNAAWTTAKDIMDACPADKQSATPAPAQKKDTPVSKK